MLERDQTLRRDGETDQTALAAFHAAEGGIARAQHALRSDPAWKGGRERIGACDVELAVRPAGEGRWSVTSRAEPGAARIEARLVLRDGQVVVADWRPR
jgi:hypothetical protein